MINQKFPLRFFRLFGLLDGISLLLLLCIAMPLKYFANLPLAVTIAGSVHGVIFVTYVISIAVAQLFIRWKLYWSILACIVAFIPFGNFVLDRYLKKHEQSFIAQPIPLVWIVYSIIFFTFIDLFTQLPIMSTYAQSLGASLTVAGFIVGIYSLSNTGGNILAGVLTDKVGAFKVLVTGLIGTTVLLVCYQIVNSVETLLLLRFLHGFVGGLVVPAAFTFVANQSKKDKAGSQNAVTGAFVGIAAIIGPAFSGIVAAKTSASTVFIVVAVFGFLLTIVTLLTLRKVKFQQSKQLSQRFQWNKQITAAFTGAFLLMFSQGALAYLLPLRVAQFGYDSRFSGTLLSVFGIVVVCIFVMRTKYIFDKIAPQYGLMLGLSLLAISQLLLGLVEHVGVYYVILAIYGVGFAFLFPSMNVLLVQGTTGENRGKAYGLFYAFFSLGTVVGSSGLGLLQLQLEGLFIATSVFLFGGVFFIYIMKAMVQQKKSYSNSPL